MKRQPDLSSRYDAPLLLTVEQSANLVGIGRTTAYALVKSGEWKTIKIGRLTRLTRRILEDWVELKASGL
jgi:excisionase family DNA binding protein